MIKNPSDLTVFVGGLTGMKDEGDSLRRKKSKEGLIQKI